LRTLRSNGVAARIEADQQHVDALALARFEFVLRLLQCVYDQRADVLARRVEHADELRFAGAIGQREGAAVLVFEADLQHVDRVARRFRGDDETGRQQRREQGC
jgi:hypothetical protein